MSNGLDVALMKDPFGSWSPENGDRNTDIAFADGEWYSFFFDTLGAVRLEREYGVRYDDAFYARDDLAFKESLKEYPLLARIEDFYQDAFFAAGEISALRDELNRAESFTLTESGKVFLNGMQAACEIAAQKNLGIRLLSS
ncbi:MAG: hypothetical protein WBC19_02575 [Pyrinomonadaceae bacterium]|nr:hypothetical protein [Pyrinomonadaceae bacterium]